MDERKKDTLTDIWIQKIKNNPLVAGMIIFCIAIAGIASFTESVSKIYQQIAKEESNPDFKETVSKTYTVDIMALPATLNHGAKLDPHGVTLEVYSKGNIQAIGVFNYPIRKEMVWSPKTGDKVVLHISIGEIELIKEYSGRLGFPNFLSEFSTGNRVFKSKEFDKNQSVTLNNFNIEFISVSFNIKGAEPVLQYLSK
jgi:hypothetical protein